MAGADEITLRGVQKGKEEGGDGERVYGREGAEISGRRVSVESCRLLWGGMVVGVGSMVVGVGRPILRGERGLEWAVT